MSTEERWTQILGKCPCGNGTVSEYVVSPDNAYSPTRTWLSVSCTKCSAEWDLVGRKLVLKSSRVDTSAIDAELNQIDRQINFIRDEVMAGYFARRGIKTAKDEWEEMKHLGFYTESLATFRKRRGVLPHSVYQFPGMNVDDGWFTQEAERTNAKLRLDELAAKKAERIAALRATNTSVVTQSVDELVPAEGETIIEE